MNISTRTGLCPARPSAASWAAGSKILKPFEICAQCPSRRYSVCACLDEREITQFYDLATRQQLEPKQRLFSEGDRAGDVFSICQGSVSLSKTLGDGRRQITGFLDEGDFIGFASGSVCAYTVEALTSVEVCRFSAESFGRFLATHPHVERRLLRMATSELAAAQDQMLLLGRKTAVERVASFLVRLSDRAVAHARPANPVPLPMTRGEIADYLGLTVETVSRTFTSLRRSAVIELPGMNMVKILSEARLRALAGKEEE